MAEGSCFIQEGQGTRPRESDIQEASNAREGTSPFRTIKGHILVAGMDLLHTSETKQARAW